MTDSVRSRFDDASRLFHDGDASAAADRLKAILEDQPDFLEAWTLLGLAQSRLGLIADAVVALETAARLAPDSPLHRRMIGDVLCGAGYPSQAIPHYVTALSAAPDDAALISALADAFCEVDHLEQAETCYRAALELAPDSAPTWNNLGNLLLRLDRLGEAEDSYRAALASDPDHALAAGNHGVLLCRMARHHEALAFYRRALDINPDLHEIRENLGRALLTLGDYTAGWQEHDRGRLVPGPLSPLRGIDAPLWTGEALEGRTLLIHAEQGLGDTIQMARYLPMLPKDGTVLVELPAQLVRLLAPLCETGSILVAGAALPACDLHLPMLSLPRVFATTLSSLPGPIPYLFADPAAVAAWENYLSALPGRKIGLVWAGRPTQGADARRSIPLHNLRPLLSVSDVTLVSLQKGSARDQIAAAGFTDRLVDPTDCLDDFADTAALVEALDLVITVDTAVVHLAGALGKPVWLLNRFDSCWRWLGPQPISPWYPSLRQFRQSAPGDWAGPIAETVTALGGRAVSAP